MQFSFRCCLWWFITLGPWSFSNDIILKNPFFITSDNSFQKRIEFIAFKMQITSVHAFCSMNFFQFMWSPNIKFFNESKTFYMTVDCWFWYFKHFFNHSHSYMTIRLWHLFGHHITKELRSVYFKPKWRNMLLKVLAIASFNISSLFWYTEKKNCWINRYHLLE